MIKNIDKSLLLESSLILEASMYAGLLLENRIEFLKKNNPEIDSSHDTLAQHRSAGDIIDHFSNNADPSKNKQHTQWILGQYKKKNIRQEDTPRIHSALSNFDKYKSKLDKKDINQYKSVSDVESAVHPHIGTTATKSEAKQDAIVKGRTLVHDDGKGLKVYRLEQTEDGKKASQEIYGGGHELGGTHTSWCTAARSDKCMFNHYSKNEPLHVIHTSTGNVYQAHPETNSLMNSKDEVVKSTNPDSNEIGKALDHIPNGVKLKITKNIGQISKEDLDTALNDKDFNVRKEVLRNPNITKEHLDKALNDNNKFVRQEAARNPNVTKEHIDKALDDEDTFVRVSAVSNPNANNIHLFRALNDESPFVRVAAVQHQNANKTHIEKALNDSDSDVRKRAVQHPNATKEHIDKALNDRDYFVREEAAKNINASKENLEKALKSEHLDIRRAAKRNPRAKEYGLV